MRRLSGIKYVPTELIEAWEKKDPIKNYEAYLLSNQIISNDFIKQLKKEINDEINSSWKIAEDEG